MTLEILSELAAIKNPKHLTKAEYFKLLVNIDKQLLKSFRHKKGVQFKGLSGPDEFDELDKSLSAVINSNITDADIDNAILSMVNANLNGLGDIDFLGKLKITLPPVIKKVATAVKTVVKKAVEVVHKVLTLPARLLTTAMLKLFKGKVSKMFIYAFVPDNSPLMQNPEVKRKAARQKNFIALLTKGAAFPPDYVMKHIRNDIQVTYKKTPEEVIQDMVNKKDADLKGTLGFIDPATLGLYTAAIAPVLVAVPAIVKSFNPKGDAPSQSDIVTAPPSNTPVTIQMPGNSSDKEGMSTGMKIGLAVGGAVLIGGGIYLATNKKSKKK